MPVFIALWLPLMRGTFMKPAEQPISAPPGKGELGHRLEAALGDGARAVGDALAPSSSGRIAGCVLNRWNSSNGDS